MKQLWSAYRTGLSVLVPIFIFFAFLAWFWSELVAISYGHTSIALAMLVLLPLGVGYFVSKKWFRNIVIQLTKDIPLVSTIVNFLLNQDYAEQMRNENLMREVMWEIQEGVWIFGVVVSRHKMPLYPQRQSSPPVCWLLVLSPTTPVLFTGHLLLVPECRVIYTGRTGTDTALTVASFGFNMQIDQEKFQRVDFEVPKEFHYQPPVKKSSE